MVKKVVHTSFKKNFNVSLKVLDATKLIQVVMDSPNVNIKLLKMIQAEWSENKQHQLSLVQVVFTKYIMLLRPELKVLVREWKKSSREPSKIFYDSPARREDFLTVTNTNQFPQSFSATKFVITYYIKY